MIDELETIQNDPIFVGHLTARWAEAIPSAVSLLKGFSQDEDSLPGASRLNYHACAVASVTAVLLLSLDDVGVFAYCDGHNIRSEDCRRLLNNKLKEQGAFKGADLYSVCPWSNPPTPTKAAKP